MNANGKIQRSAVGDDARLREFPAGGRDRGLSPFSAAPVFGGVWGEWVESAGVSSPLPELEDETKEGLETPWNVVVYNDPVNLMSYVTKIFMKILGFSLEKAEQHMMEVHKKGRSIVWSGEREKAEFYIQQLHGALLLASLERSL